MPARGSMTGRSSSRPDGPACTGCPPKEAKLERTGEPFRLGDFGGSPSVSADGTLVLDSQASDFFGLRQLVWVDRSGTMGGTVGLIRKGIGAPRLSPDERFIAYNAGENS